MIKKRNDVYLNVSVCNFPICQSVFLMTQKESCLRVLMGMLQQTMLQRKTIEHPLNFEMLVEKKKAEFAKKKKIVSC